ncbi:MAG: EAL domain-containing protein [Acidobacteria bacterium]|nr:EAL domain-containing protein [Acidobacteriota bacterium]
MPEFHIGVLATFAAQIIGAAVTAVLLYGFNRQYRKSYLQHWTRGWAALTLYHLSGAASMVLALRLRLPATAPSRIIATLADGISGYLMVGWFLFGIWEFVRRRPIRMFAAQRMLAALVVIGVIASLLFINRAPISEERYLTRVGVRALFAAIGFGTVALTLWRARRNRPGLGFSILAVAFFCYALEQLHYLTIGLIWAVAGTYLDFALWIGVADFLIQAVIGIGMIACLLEDEREAAELAAVQIEHLAYHDALTGLPNRPLFMDRLIVALAQADRSSQRLAVFFLDLDRFKDINDSLGHTVGDALLKAVAERIRRCVREGDTVARLGGDEFTLLIPRTDNVEDVAKVAQKILETLKIPFFIHERELFVTTSIGISIYPNDGLDPETLLRNADSAMYRAKDQGRDNYQLYAPAMNARALERLALENMLRKAVAQKELIVHYQPLVDLHSRHIIGVEALVRWDHPQLGLLSPAHFISVAEISGLIIPIGNWVLRTACRQLRIWQKRIDYDLTLSVNLSARQFQQPDLVEQIRSAVNDSGIHPSSLELEITESNAMQNAENTSYTLRELKALGVRIAMDDFGTGYSSLNYLKRFPIDTLKLDQTFVREVTTDPSDAAIVSAVISMAHSLNLAVVAEGVETEGQLAFLRRQRCDRIQGNLFSPAVSAEMVEPLLAEKTAKLA